MRRLLKVKDALSQMVIGHQWGVWKISNSERAQRIRDLILNESWWARVAYVLDFIEPIMTMLHFADTDTPCLGDVYDGMDTMVEKVKHSIQAHESDPTQCEALCKQVQAIIHHRSNKMTNPLHLLAYVLSPRYYSEEVLSMPGRVAPFADEEVAEGCHKALTSLFPLEEMHEKVREEFRLLASGLRHSPFALKDQNRLGAITWWYMYGQPFRHLQPLAIKVLSQVSFLFCFVNLF